MNTYYDIDKQYLQKDAEDEWRRCKWGKFSASEIDNLMTLGQRETFSAGGIAYIERIAREAYTIFNDSENNETFAMKQGKKKEAEAFQFYRQLLGRDDFEYYGGGNPYFEHYSNDSGASPDCLLWKDRANKIVSFGAEFKCPTSKIHWDYIRSIKTQFDLKQMNPLYYGQCQFGMMTFKTDLWHWCSYNEYYPIKHRMKIIEIVPDKNYQSNLKIREQMAVKKKYQFLEEIRNAA
jgi:hypothetical protein